MSLLRNFKLSMRYSNGIRRLFTCNHLKNQSIAQKVGVGKFLLTRHHSIQNKPDSKLRNSYSLNHFNISNVSNVESDGLLKIEWDDDTSCEFPHIFLRDNCQCPRCFYADIKSRYQYTFEEIDVDISPDSVSLTENTIKVTWPDGHSSEYTSEWLRDHIFSDSKSKPTFGIEQKYWDSELINEVKPFIQYSDWIEKDESAMKNIEYLLRYGICIIKNGPPRDHETSLQICKRIGRGYNKASPYGYTFTVKTTPDRRKIAYTSKFFPLHLDMAFLKNQAEIQYLHCVDGGGEDGGASLFSDGFMAAENLRLNDKDAFDILSETVMKFQDAGEDEYGVFDSAHERSTFEFDRSGTLDTINYNNFTRSAQIKAPSHKIKDFYRAMYKLSSLLNHEKHVFKIQLEPGDMVTFDNRRVLHGRTGYDPTKTNRWLEGGFLELDSLTSKYRTMRKGIINS